MRSTSTIIFLAALLAQPLAGYAQEADTDTSTEETEAPADQPAADTEAEPEPGADLNLGEPVGPQVGQTYVLNEFGDWQMRCVKAPEGQAEPCNLYQLLRDDAGNEVAEVNIFRLPEGGRAAAGANIVVPLETLLTQQLTLSVDGGSTRRYPFTFCNAAGCVARVGFTLAEVNQFKAGASATLRLVPAAAPDEEVLLTMSLSGFTAAYDGTVTIE
ncbi:invasion associated locus B family protein [Yoonia sp. SS1-5]|uniref:Invasion associated locus B family protein n=1 Tax=Yoonia rhodophyticola TaxID=3137370 RepID=A0AAN0NJZ3_9RHOB